MKKSIQDTKCILKAALIFMLYFITMLLITLRYTGKDYEKKPYALIIRYNGIASGKEAVDEDRFEKDILYFIKKGYSPVFVSDIAKAINKDAALPKKAVAILIEGHTCECKNKVLDILNKYNFKANVSVSGKETEYSSNCADDNSVYLRWDDITTLNQTGVFEFSNAGFSLIQDTSGQQKNNESYEHYRSRLIRDIDKNQQLFVENCRFEPVIFIYPDVKINEFFIKTIKNLGFFAAVGNKTGINYTNDSQRMNLKCIYRNKQENIYDLCK